MGLLSSILKIGGAALGTAVGVGPGVGAAVGGAIGGAIDGGNSSNQSQAAARQAGQVQADAARQAGRVINQEITSGKAQFSPFRANNGVSGSFQLQKAFSGALGLKAQQDAFNNYQSDPGTAFLIKQGTEAINRNAAARGGLGGGNRLKRLSEFNQGIALQHLNNRFNQLQNVTSTEYGAAANTANVGIKLSNNLANSIMSGGQYQASGIVGAENARLSGQIPINRAFGGAAQKFIGSNTFKNLFNPSPTAPPTSQSLLTSLPGINYATNPTNYYTPPSTIYNVPSTQSFSGGLPTVTGLGG